MMSRRRELAEQTFVVRPGEHYVNVIVPGDVSLMTHGAEQRTSAERIAQSVSSTEFMDPVENTELYFAYFGGAYRTLAHSVLCKTVECAAYPLAQTYSGSESEGGDAAVVERDPLVRAVTRCRLLSAEHYSYGVARL